MKILLIGPIVSSFVKNDIDILSEKHELELENGSPGRGLRGAVNLLTLTVRCAYKILRSDAVFCWFADYASLFPTLFARLLGKKAFVVAGGFDVAYRPEINYGAKANKLRWFCVKNTFKYATKIIPVSHFADLSLKAVTEGKCAKSEVVYNCIKSGRFINNKSDKPKRDIMLSVSQGDSEIDYILKGNDFFIKSASFCPETQFVMAGLRGAALELAKQDAKDITNVTILSGPLKLYEELIPLYNRAIAYVQPSVEESFGVAVLEAMACGAAPIITNAGALPEISGEVAIIVEKPEDMPGALLKAKNINDSDRDKYITRVKAFDFEVRKESLLNSILK